MYNFKVYTVRGINKYSWHCFLSVLYLYNPEQVVSLLLSLQEVTIPCFHAQILIILLELYPLQSVAEFLQGSNHFTNQKYENSISKDLQFVVNPTVSLSPVLSHLLENGRF